MLWVTAIRRDDEPWSSHKGPTGTETDPVAAQSFVRDMTTFVLNEDGSWHRDNEHHENVLVDTTRIPALLRAHGVVARVGTAFGAETLPEGLRVVIGHRPA